MRNRRQLRGYRLHISFEFSNLLFNLFLLRFGYFIRFILKIMNISKGHLFSLGTLTLAAFDMFLLDSMMSWTSAP
jgi:hypothetical protein